MADAKDKKSKDMGKAAHAREAADIKSWSQEADVVIVGYGGAGSCAAIEARAAGAEVLVLERAWQGGGTSIQASGQLYLGGGTPLQKACGFDDDPDEMFKYLVASCGPGPTRRSSATSGPQRRALPLGDAAGRALQADVLPVEVGTDPYTDDGLSYTGSELRIRSARLARRRRAVTPRSRWAKRRPADAPDLHGQGDEERRAHRSDALCENLIVERDGRVVACWQDRRRGARGPRAPRRGAHRRRLHPQQGHGVALPPLTSACAFASAATATTAAAFAWAWAPAATPSA